jgi:hypothetical protein
MRKIHTSHGERGRTKEHLSNLHMT